jgi:hypothetical protein
MAMMAGKWRAGRSWRWKEVYPAAKFVMAPRGFGRNSYRLCEVLQLGMVPVVVYSDFLWLPYYDSIGWHDIALITDLDGVNATLDWMAKYPMQKVTEMRQRVRALWATHFCVEAVWRHIRWFLKFGFAVSDLRCARYSRVAEENHLGEVSDGRQQKASQDSEKVSKDAA